MFMKCKQRKILFFVFVLVQFVLFQDCASTPAYLTREEILDMNPKLNDVLEKYKDDSLKYKAALFLIDNLPYHEGVINTDLTPMYKTYELFGTGKYSPEQAKDSAFKLYGTWCHPLLRTQKDIFIEPDYLIDNIEWSFKVWNEQPWGKNISFEQFCEYILPYRVGNEELLFWREKIYNQFMPIIERVRDNINIEDPIFAANVVLDSLLRAPFYFTEQISTDVRIGPNIVDTRGGSCLDLTDMLVYIYRALGIPCGIDMLPIRGNNNATHFWNFTEDKEGKTWYFSMFYWWHRLLEAEKYGDVYGKVYRNTFGLNKKMMNDMLEADDSIHPIFKYPCIKDVTDLYAANKSWTLRISSSKMYEEVRKGCLMYLCMSSRMEWIPVDWCIYEGEAVFQNCHGGTVYCLGIYDAESEHLVMVSDPFSVDVETGKTDFYTPEDVLEEIILFSKFGTIGEYFLAHMKGGVFEGSNDPIFKNVDTLYIINETPNRLCTSVNIDTDKLYRYVRYYGPKDGYTNVAEIEFYSLDTQITPLKGDIICREEYKNDPAIYNVFDGMPDTSFGCSMSYGGWIGMDFGLPVNINRITCWLN